MCTPSIQIRLPKQYPVLTWWVGETSTVKVIVLVVELKANISGLTVALIPSGGSIIACTWSSGAQHL